MSRFENFKVDEISIDDAEDDICFNAKEHFEDSPMMSLIGLRFTEDESTIEWEKRKVEYSPTGQLPKDFKELLTDHGNNCSFLFALHPENVKKKKRNIDCHWQCTYLCGQKIAQTQTIFSPSKVVLQSRGFRKTTTEQK